MRSKIQLPEHFCGCIPVAISIQTTGKKPFFHDLVSMNLVPLGNDFNPLPEVFPVQLSCVPKRPSNYSHKNKGALKGDDFREIIRRGDLPSDTREKFETWYSLFGLKKNKRLIPVCWDWGSIEPFLLDFFGYDSEDEPILYQYFNREVRSLKDWCTFLNDLAWVQSYQYPFVFQENRLGRTVTSCDEAREEGTYKECLNVAKVFKSLTAIKEDCGRLMVDNVKRLPD